MVKSKILFAAFLLLGSLAGQAQEKVMNILKADGTTAQTRVADLKEISFLSVEEGGKGLIVKTLGGETAAVLFEANPVVTVSNGKLNIKPKAADAIEFEISDIAEIVFGDASDATAIKGTEGFAFVLQEDGAVLRGIPGGSKPLVYSIDGRKLPTPSFSNGELKLNRATLGSGIYIVKVGTFTTKVKL
jgi:hypothetical protein